MGGCRCTYRNCSVRSDGKTHFFHYPVFDKLRCREWILNARKMKLFSLTVYQLKNRVVCQHHFRDDMFMNDEKNQLKYMAIPTENGPYCTDYSSPIAPNELKNIIADEALNSKPMTSNKKKSSLSLKYMDFLTNNQDDFLPRNSSPPTVANVPQISIEGNIMNQNTFINDIKHIPQDIKIENSVFQSNNQNSYTRTGNSNNRKIQILSETVISKPLTFTPTGNILDMKCDISQNTDNMFIDVLNKSRNNILEVNVPPRQLPEAIKVEDNYKDLDKVQFTQEIPTGTRTPVSKPLPKQSIKLTPERRAAIAEKRNFNMKLRDYIEAGLNGSTTMTENSQLINEGKNKRVIVSKESEVELLDVLECKLQTMQNTLLRKIEENSKQIAELKQSKSQEKTSVAIVNRSLLKTKDNCSTQTEWSLNELKKYLFNSVSEFISPELKNRLYEELFIDIFIENTDSAVGKGRKSKKRRMNVQVNET